MFNISDKLIKSSIFMSLPNSFNLILSIIVIAFCVIQASYVAAQPTKHMNIVIDSADFYPYYYRDKGKLIGPMPEITKAVLTKMGYSVTFLEAPWAKAVDLVKRQQVDAITGIFYRKTREQFLHYPQHYPVESVLSLIAPIGSRINYTGDIAQLDGKDIGAVNGWSYNLFSKALKVGRIDFKDERILVRNIALKRIGLGIGNPTSLLKFAQEQGLQEQISVLKPPVEVTPLYTAFAKKPGYTQLSQDFAEALMRFKTSKEFQQIIHLYSIQ
jgi:polar amino acid transport system substrate-binding protein